MTTANPDPRSSTGSQFVTSRKEAWSEWARIPLERGARPYWWLAGIAVLVVVLEQSLEQILLDTGPAGFRLSRLLLPVLTFYMLAMWKFLRGATLNTVIVLRPVVRVDDATYDYVVKRMLRVRGRTYAMLLVISVGIVILAFVVMGGHLPFGKNVHLPANLLLTSLIVAVYTFFGWLGLALSYCAVKHAVRLGALANSPLVINPLDPEPVLPFGRLSLFHSGSLVGIILILLLALGQPQQPVDFFVIFVASTASLLALFVPLWGVHQQIARTREAALRRICEQFDRVQADLVGDADLTTSELTDIATRAEKLAQLRTQVLQGPNWPFRNMYGVARALVAAASPLVLVLLTRLIELFVLPLFTK